MQVIHLSPVYTIQPVVKPVEYLYTRYNRLSNQYRVYKNSTGWKPGLTTSWTNSGCSLNRLSNGCIV